MGVVDACPVCGWGGVARRWSLADRFYGTPGSFSVCRCEGCRSVYLLNPPADSAAHYPEGYYSFAPRAVALRRSGVASARLHTGALVPRLRDVDGELARAYAGGGATVLDVGCGAGAALDRYKSDGWATFGVEAAEPAADAARARGHEVLVGDFLEVELPVQPFRLVRFRHSLEHMGDPAAAVEKAASLLAPGGVLLIELPNVEGWLARIAGGAYWQLDPPRHLVIPAPRPLVRLVEGAGFRDVETSTYSEGRGIANSVFGRLETSGPPFQRLVARAAEPLAALADLFRRGDNLRLLARKP